MSRFIELCPSPRKGPLDRDNPLKLLHHCICLNFYFSMVTTGMIRTLRNFLPTSLARQGLEVHSSSKCFIYQAPRPFSLPSTSTRLKETTSSTWRKVWMAVSCSHFSLCFLRDFCKRLLIHFTKLDEDSVKKHLLWT